jgi:hypothetical protein
MAATAGGNKNRNAKLVSNPTSQTLEFRSIEFLVPPLQVAR